MAMETTREEFERRIRKQRTSTGSFYDVRKLASGLYAAQETRDAWRGYHLASGDDDAAMT